MKGFLWKNNRTKELIEVDAAPKVRVLSDYFGESHENDVTNFTTQAAETGRPRVGDKAWSDGENNESDNAQKDPVFVSVKKKSSSSPYEVESNNINAQHDYYKSMNDDDGDAGGVQVAIPDIAAEPSYLNSDGEYYIPSLSVEGEEEKEEVYIVKQRVGYASIAFSVVQIIVLSLMMIQCGVAPLKINPMIGPYPHVLSDWGAKNTVLILEDNEWWRLLTPIFLHAGVIHLLCNVAVQLETGVFFEQEWGSTRWLTIYLLSAVGSTILSVVAMPDAISVGSSGAVMGLFGAKLSEVVMRGCDRVRMRTKQDHVAYQVRKEHCGAVTISVIVVLLFSFVPYIDWSAHLGGLVVGMLVGICIFAYDIESRPRRIICMAVGVAATVIYFSVTLGYMYSGAIDAWDELRDVCEFYQQYEEDYECQCQR